MIESIMKKKKNQHGIIILINEGIFPISQQRIIRVQNMREKHINEFNLKNLANYLWPNNQKKKKNFKTSLILVTGVVGDEKEGRSNLAFDFHVWL